MDSGRLQKGLSHTRQAIEADPAFADPFVVLAYLYSMLGHFGTFAPADAFPKAKAAALRTLAIDETAAGVHFSLGIVHLLYDWDWSGAEAEIVRGLELAPTSAQHDRAIEQIHSAADLDPSLIAAQSLYAVLLSRAGRFDKVGGARQKMPPDSGLGLAGGSTLWELSTRLKGERKKPGESPKNSKLSPRFHAELGACPDLCRVGRFVITRRNG